LRRARRSGVAAYRILMAVTFNVSPDWSPVTRTLTLSFFLEALSACSAFWLPAWSEGKVLAVGREHAVTGLDAVGHQGAFARMVLRGLLI